MLGRRLVLLDLILVLLDRCSIVVLGVRIPLVLTGLGLGLEHLAFGIPLWVLGNSLVLFLNFVLLELLLIVDHDVLALVTLLLLESQSLSVLLLFGVETILLLLLHLQLKLVLIRLVGLVGLRPRYNLAFLLDSATVRVSSLLILYLLLMGLMWLPQAACHVLAGAVREVSPLCVLIHIVINLLVFVTCFIHVLLLFLVFIILSFRNFNFSHSVFQKFG